MRRTPLNRKRETPRRNEGRVSHERLKPKATGKTSEERRFHGLLASLGCLVCGRAAEVHHVMHAAGKFKRRDHRFCVPLCPDHHRGPQGVHGLGSEGAFRDLWGVDLVGWCMAAWSLRDVPDAPFWQDSVTRCRETARMVGGRREL